MTNRQVTIAVKNYIQKTFGYTTYKGQVRSYAHAIVIDNRQDFAPYMSAQEICEAATGLKFLALGLSMATMPETVKI